MKYYLLDEEKLRTILENKLVLNEASEEYDDNISRPIYSIKLKNVNYRFLGDYAELSPLSLYEAIPSLSSKSSKENPHALTTEGFIEWKNFTKILSDRGSKPLPLENYLIRYGQFCSSYICIGATPSQNAIKIRPENIRLNQHLIDSYSIEEKEDELII